MPGKLIDSFARLYAAAVTGVAIYAMGIGVFAYWRPQRTTNPSVTTIALGYAGNSATLTLVACAILGVVACFGCYWFDREPPAMLTNSLLVAIVGTVCAVLLLPA